MLPDFLLQILNNHGDDLQQLALLSYLKSEDKGRPFLEAVTAAKVRTKMIENAVLFVQGYLFVADKEQMMQKTCNAYDLDCKVITITDNISE